MPSDVTFRRVPLLPVAGLVLVVFAVLGALYLNWSQSDSNRWVAHTLDVEVAIARLRGDVLDAESAHRGYLLSGDPTLQDRVEAASRRARAGFADLRTLTADNPVEQRALDQLAPLLARKLEITAKSIDRYARTANGIPVAALPKSEGREIMAQIEVIVDRMRAEEEKLSVKRVDHAQLMIDLLGAGQAAALVLVLVAAFLTVGDARRRFQAMQEARDEARGAEAQVRAEIEGREAAEAALRQIQKMESIGQLTGGIAHDFNNMLAIVIGSLDMAARRSGDPVRVARAIANAREGAERAAALTGRLLAFSRQSPLAPVALDANRLVAGMSELLHRTLGETIQIETVLAAGLWPSFADPHQLENALLNLAVNARDAMAEGGKLTIETANVHFDDAYAAARHEVAPGQYVMLCVTDTGSGMPADVIEKAFEPFFTTKQVGKGTGLGLSQVFGFAKQSGGHVAIYSELGQGTTVKLYLPRHFGAVQQPGVAAPSEALPLGRAEEIILVVEDEQRVRHFSVDALRDLGYTVLSAHGGVEALAMLAEQPSIALLFTDVVMPEMNGRKLADAARAQRPNLPVLYTTGYTRNAVVHNGMLDAGVALLQKPFTIEQLARKVRDVIDGGGANRG
ncbi:MAG: CHASE3 domain-containing protein [Sphingomonadaceae bacterium]|nr:CHASE3 domain-containing protein [Sphingomonadaceae bacterium]